MHSIRCNSCVKSWRNKKDLQRITKNKPFANKYNWKGINFPSEKNDWTNFEKNDWTIGLNVLYAKKQNTYSAYVSKHISNCEKQVILLMILNGEGWHYLAVKKLLVLLRGITSKYHSDFSTYFLSSGNIMESPKRPSKYHLSIDFLAEKKTAFPITEKFKTRTFQ